MTSKGLGEGLACADPGARTPIGASGNFKLFWVVGWVVATRTVGSYTGQNVIQVGWFGSDNM